MSEMKRGISFGFEGGGLDIKLEGYGDQNGSGHFAFSEEELQWDEDQETGRVSRWVKVEKSELLEIRNLLNRLFPPSELTGLRDENHRLRREVAFKTEELGKYILRAADADEAKGRTEDLDRENANLRLRVDHLERTRAVATDLATDRIEEIERLRSIKARLESELLDMTEIASHARAEFQQLRTVLEQAKQDFLSIRSLNSHGASDETYIGWLRNNAQAGAERIDAALKGEKA